MGSNILSEFEDRDSIASFYFLFYFVLFFFCFNIIDISRTIAGTPFTVCYKTEATSIIRIYIYIYIYIYFLSI